MKLLCFISRILHPRMLRKTFRIMKLTSLIMVVGLLHVHAKGLSQKINLHAKQITLFDIFKSIGKQSGYNIIYDASLINREEKVKINITDASIEQALKICLQDKNLTYQIKGKSIVINASIYYRSDPQKITIKGKVTNDKGQPLVGASVLAKGTPIGTSTDSLGEYQISVTENQKILVFSYVGCESQEININDQQIIDVVLIQKNSDMDEVVVAFGKKKKADVVGSVVSVNPADLKIPASNLTASFAGRIPGMIAFQRSGEPGADNANFFVRGVSTFGTNKSPLILIDGVESSTTDLARLQVDDIQSFSVLKDATATALYGSRAANGVLLIATKQGKSGSVRINFRAENSKSAPTESVELADPVTYMKLQNEAMLTRNPQIEPRYSEDQIENTEAGNNPILFPAVDWKNLLFKDNTTTQRLNLSASGGGGAANYYVSGSLNKDNGLMNVDRRNNFNSNISLLSYSLRSNVDINLTQSSKLTVRLWGSFDDYTGPIDGGTAMYNKIMHTSPVLFPAYYPNDTPYNYIKHIMFGNYDQGQYVNPYADMVKGYKQYSKSQLNAQLEFNQNFDFLAKGLSFNAMMNIGRYAYYDIIRQYTPFWYKLSSYNVFTQEYYLTEINPNTGTEYLDYNQDNQTKNLSTSFYFQARVNYARTFGNDHNLNGMLVYMQQNKSDANAGTLQKSLPNRNMGVSGRFTYDYDKRYFAEFNFGYNGSERFDAHHRFGFFPSAGVAWIASNEAFLAPIKGVVTNLKLRATYGIIGNDAIGTTDDRFFYLSDVNMNNTDIRATFGENQTYFLNGISINRYADPNITWETSTQKNFAVDLSLWNKLDFTAEYYTQNRKKILMNRASIPLEAGYAAAIRANVGEAKGEGVDLSLNYKQSFNNSLWASLMGNFTYALTKYSKYEEPQYKESYRTNIGTPVNQTFGFIAERLFVDDAEANNSPFQNYGIYGGGDIKYTDVNRDGQITDADMVPIGHPTTPAVIYGFGFSMGYKGFDASAFFQGLAQESFFIDPNATWPFAQNTAKTINNALLKSYADDHWSEDNRNVYALFPRLSETVNSNDVKSSTWWMRNGSFLRLKQVELGYTLPAKIQKRIHTSGFRIYVNATNLLNFSHFGLWDVEMGGDGLGYPIQRVLNVGLNININ